MFHHFSSCFIMFHPFSSCSIIFHHCSLLNPSNHHFWRWNHHFSRGEFPTSSPPAAFSGAVGDFPRWSHAIAALQRPGVQGGTPSFWLLVFNPIKQSYTPPKTPRTKWCSSIFAIWGPHFVCILYSCICSLHSTFCEWRQCSSSIQLLLSACIVAHVEELHHHRPQIPKKKRVFGETKGCCSTEVRGSYAKSSWWI